MKRWLGQVKNYIQEHFPNVYAQVILLKYDLFNTSNEQFACKEIDTFLSDEEKRDPIIVKKTRRDIFKCMLQYGSSPLEYFLFGFRNKSISYRNTFLTDGFREKLLAKVEGIGPNKQLLDDKYLFYQRNSQFFLRKCMQIPVGG